MMEKIIKSWKAIAVVGLIILAILSASVFGNIASKPQTYADTIQTLEEQKQDALMLNVAVTATAATLSMLPDDTASPIAEELADLSVPLFVIVAVLYTEKFLLTTFGWISFTFLVPGACGFASLYLIFKKYGFLEWARKLAILALALVCVIPFGAKITTQIENTFAESVEATFSTALNVTEETTDVDEEEGNWFTDLFEDMVDNVAGLIDMAKKVLSTMVDAVAVLLITSCVIPILTALAFAWVIKLLFNASAPSDKLMHMIQHQGEKLAKLDPRKLVKKNEE